MDTGTRLYDIMTSCIRLFRTGVTACNNALVKEACCAGARQTLSRQVSSASERN